MQDDETDEVPAWVLSFFADRSVADLAAWWDAVKRLYGPLGVRMDFRTATHAPADVIGSPRSAAT